MPLYEYNGQKLPPNSLCAGAPAVVKRELEKRHQEMLDLSVAAYRELTANYIKSFNLIP